MAKTRVIIADEDENYIIPLQHKFIVEFFNEIELEVITDSLFFDEFFSKPQSAEILIVSENLYNASLQRHNIQNIFKMMERYEDGDTGDLSTTQLFKYTSIKEIFNEIIGKSAETINVTLEEKKEAQIILVTSAAGGVGKTTIATGISACLEKNYKRVLYIEASRLQCFQGKFDNNTPITEREIYSKLIKPTERIYGDIKHVIRKEEFSYLPNFKAALMSVGVEYSIFEKIAISAKNSGDFDYIVIDAESTFDEDKTSLLDLSDKVIIVTEQDYNAVMATNCFVDNIDNIYSEKYIFVCNKFDNEAYNAIISQDIQQAFVVNEYIPIMKKNKIGDMKELYEMDELKKVAFFCI
ncbi:MAG: AAA family ATPase [Lachnospiraceae bacterium]|nr:AAA family ATPase [Lachnospiraceae bacterium]